MRFRLCLLAAAAIITQTGTSPAQPGKRLSIDNRILLNRLAVSGRRSLQVMLMVDEARLDDVSALVDRLHGRVRHVDRPIGYVRAEVPLDMFIALVADPAVVAYQISSLAQGAWYRDAPAQATVELSRSRETDPIAGLEPVSSPPSKLPMLSAEAARAPGYTADDDVGVGAWLAEHPTFDGRGVTIAVIESALAEFGHPMFAPARTLDNRPIAKLAGIINAVDDDETDATRVDLSTEIHATSSWCRVGTRTYIVPRPGTYRLGFFSLPGGHNLVQRFAVIEDQTTGEIRLDANGDADFRAEPPIPDVNTAFEPHALHVPYPRPVDVAFVIGRSPAPHRVHVYTAQSSHQAMSWGVAAGSRTEEGLAFGVAPAARVLLVRYNSSAALLHHYFEAFLRASKRADVDVVSASITMSLIPDTAADFAGVFFDRLVAAYRKPIFQATGNQFHFIGTVQALGGVFSVGGSITPQTFEALFGGARLPQTIVHPFSSGGPGLDGLFKPDFIAPVHRLAGSLPIDAPTALLPKNHPIARLPAGYRISCCTSASTPYAAGVAALLASAAKQQNVPYSAESLGRALRATAHFLPNEAAHLQGAGVIDVREAWRELQHRDGPPPRIRISGPTAHALTAYAAHGADGVGLYEREGWAPGMSGTRTLRFTRESGSQDPMTYRLRWTGNDGTFASPTTITLPLKQEVSVELTIAAKTAGVHSAILSLRDPVTDALVLQTMPTIVVAKPLHDGHRSARFDGVVALMRNEQLYVSVPDRAGAIAIDLDVLDGSVTAGVLPSDGMIRDFFQIMPLAASRTLAKGRYSVILPRPAVGVWSVTVVNDSAWRETNPALLSLKDAQYAVSVRLLSASVEVQSTSGNKAVLDIANVGAPLHETAVDVSTGTLKSVSAETEANGLPNQVAIDVPAGASTLALDLHATQSTSTLELHLYDCTSGECFTYDFTVPAAHEQSMIVRDPRPGRWIAAVNTAPFPLARDRFTLDAIISRAVGREPSASAGPHPPGSRWTQVVDLPHERWMQTDGTPIVMMELVDVTDERDNKAHPWETREGLVNFADRPAVIGRAVLHLK